MGNGRQELGRDVFTRMEFREAARLYSSLGQSDPSCSHGRMTGSTAEL